MPLVSPILEMEATGISETSVPTASYRIRRKVHCGRHREDTARVLDLHHA